MQQISLLQQGDSNKNKELEKESAVLLYCVNFISASDQHIQQLKLYVLYMLDYSNKFLMKAIYVLWSVN